MFYKSHKFNSQIPTQKLRRWIPSETHDGMTDWGNTLGAVQEA
jgi:hypothetical protein